MPTTSRLQLPYPEGTQSNDVEGDLKKIADALDLKVGAVTQVQNTLPPHDGVGKQFVWVRSQATLYYDDGAVWHIVVQPTPAANLDVRKKWPVGSLRFTATPGLPDEDGHVGEWLFPDGSYISAAMYPTYAEEVGATWGPIIGDTVRLPVMTDRVPVGIGPLHALGALGGQRERTLTANHIPRHTHPLLNADHTHNPAPGHEYVITSPVEAQHWITGLEQERGGPGNIQVTRTVNEFPDQTMSIGENASTQASFNLEQPWTGVNVLVKVH